MNVQDKSLWRGREIQELWAGLVRKRPENTKHHCRGYQSQYWPFLYFLINFHWSIVALEYCVSFCYTAKWISCAYTCIPSLLDFLPIQVTTEHSPFFFSLSVFPEHQWDNPMFLGGTGVTLRENSDVTLWVQGKGLTNEMVQCEQWNSPGWILCGKLHSVKVCEQQSLGCWDSKLFFCL